MGHGEFNLPYDVPANEFLTIEGKKLSTSRNWAVWVPDYLARYDPDPLRYLLSINMPETSDTEDGSVTAVRIRIRVLTGIRGVSCTSGLSGLVYAVSV